MLDELDLKSRMVKEAALILRSVNWTEKQISLKMRELSAMEERGEDFVGLERIEIEILNLIHHLNKELSNMDTFMRKYKTIIEANKNEKKKSLRHLGQKKQIRLRGISKNARGQKGGNRV